MSEYYLPLCTECGSHGWDFEANNCLRPECEGTSPEFLYASWPES